ncbi:hypothetical protein ABZY81_39870 [Streptomyces sp. NPDC006514]|uniref:hypothetical protein n=1 Tax=Streptomyces sp. NPDC006514 TaxID=3154308 RepID=UPI0033BDC81E
MRRYGFDIEHPAQWEVEALEPDELRRLVLAAVDPYVAAGPRTADRPAGRTVPRSGRLPQRLRLKRWSLRLNVSRNTDLQRELQHATGPCTRRTCFATHASIPSNSIADPRIAGRTRDTGMAGWPPAFAA